MFLSTLGRRVLAVAFMALLAVTFLASVGASIAQVPLGNLLDAGNPLLRIFPATGADPTGDTATTDPLVPETSEDRTDEAHYAESQGGEAAFDAAFVHRATPENVIANSTYLDDPSIEGDPDAILLYVTQNWNPGGGAGTYNNHPVGVWYDASRQGWAIFNQDLAAMTEGAAFNVVVVPLKSPVEVG